MEEGGGVLGRVGLEEGGEFLEDFVLEGLGELGVGFYLFVEGF